MWMEFVEDIIYNGHGQVDLSQGRRQQEMLRINQLKLAPDHTEQELKKLLLTTLHLKEGELLEYHIHKRSIDARKKADYFLFICH